MMKVMQTVIYQVKIKMLLFSQRISKLVIVLLYCSILEIAFADDKSIPLIWHVPSSNDYFIGRQEELQALSKIIRKYHKAVIIGPGGIGKTQLACILNIEYD
jgi:DNA replication protein DnaC